MIYSRLARWAGVFILVNIISSFVFVYFIEIAVEREADKHFRKLTNMASFAADIQYRRVKFNLMKRSLSLQGISIQRAGREDKLHIGSFTVGDLDYLFMTKVALQMVDPTKEFPGSLEFRLSSVELPLENLPQLAPLMEMGYKKAYLDFAAGYTYDASSEVFQFKARAASHHMAELNLNLDLADFNMRDVMTGLQSKNFMPLMALSLRAFELKFIDHSLMARANWYLYQKQKTTLAYTFTMFRKRMPVGGEYQKIMDTMQTFLDQPKSFALVAAPAQPVPVMKMLPLLVAKQDELAQVANIKLVANK